MITLPNFDCQIIQFDNNEIHKKTITLIELIKAEQKGLILYFYPKNNTQGCTLQAIEFSALQQAFFDNGYIVIGISRDGTKSHENFICKQNLSIPLISDNEEVLCQHFDVIKEKNMYGKKVMGVVRSTFVFDKEGQSQYEFRNIKAKTHQHELLTLLSSKSS